MFENWKMCLKTSESFVAWGQTWEGRKYGTKYFLLFKERGKKSNLYNIEALLWHIGSETDMHLSCQVTRATFEKILWFKNSFLYIEFGDCG